MYDSRYERVTVFSINEIHKKNWNFELFTRLFCEPVKMTTLTTSTSWTTNTDRLLYSLEATTCFCDSTDTGQKLWYSFIGFK